MLTHRITGFFEKKLANAQENAPQCPVVIRCFESVPALKFLETTLDLLTDLPTYLSVALQSFVGHGPLFQFLNPIHGR
jgi:hypothetical protein